MRWFLLAVTLVTPVVAWAHAFLDHAQPAVGATVTSPPKMLRLWFSEDLEAAFCRVEVTAAATGRSVAAGPANAAAGDPRELEVPLTQLVPGHYRVSWKAVSVDTHVTHGDFEFTVQ